ncbi:MAG: TetR/AcrR family transcriptional regulator C-terminal domain-containing protein [Ruminococcus sp.]|nr:TetR/AcrR family transcriptional regulator C-terminal domain-containing protein [Ruminococcus sp.]
MENIKIDRRIKKTKKSIYNAVAELLTQKDVNLITIKEICEIADINRKTFYNYYTGIYDVIDEIENNVLDVLCKSIDNINLEEAMKEPYIVFEKLNEIINTDIEFYGHLISQKPNYHFVDKTVAELKNRTKNILKEKLVLPEYKLDIMLDYAYAGMMNVYQKWFNSEYDLSLEQSAKEVSVMCFGGINKMIESGNT